MNLSMARALKVAGKPDEKNRNGAYCKRADRMYWCDTNPVFRQEGERLRLVSAEFCRDRMCPMCNWRKSIKAFYQLSEVMDVAQNENPTLDTIFLTLTHRNCTGPELEAALKQITDGWTMLTRHRRFKSVVKGWFRTLEVTYDGQQTITQEMHQKRPEYYIERGLKIGDANPNYDTFNQHLHVLLMVDKPYFSDPKLYLHTADWVKLWRTSSKTEYDPVCWVQGTRTTKGRERAHLAEVVKYVVKEKDIFNKAGQLTVKPDVIDYLARALYRRRLVAYGGVLKEIYKRLGMVDPEEADLVNIDENDTIREDVAEALISYKWDFGLSDYIRER